MSTLSAPLIASHKSASFVERGVSVPFTTPTLAGARIRPAERTGTEFVVPNPAGGRGVYVLHWGAVRQFCRPTVHDTLLYQRISRLPTMDPRGVRATARQLAAEGLAGREASLAALAAAKADGQEQVLINFLMLVTLMEQIEPTGLRIGAETERSPELDRRARKIVSQLAAAAGRSPEQIGDDLEALSDLFVTVGLEAETPPGWLQRLTGRLDSAADSLTAWANRFPNDESAPLASTLARSARVTARCAVETLRDARAMTRDMRGLLRTWTASPAEVAKYVNRPEWLLDGWDRFCVLWEVAGDIGTQRTVLPEMMQQIPPLPREGNEFALARSELDSLEPVLQNAQMNPGWRGAGSSHAPIARNERLRALMG